MTTEIEKQFFEAFGIEPKRGVELTIDPTTDDNVMNEHNVCYGYPQITDRILLELICILSKYQKDRGSLLEICEISLGEIKEEILEMLIYRVDGLERQVQALFKENYNG